MSKLWQPEYIDYTEFCHECEEELSIHGHCEDGNCIKAPDYLRHTEIDGDEGNNML